VSKAVSFSKPKWELAVPGRTQRKTGETRIQNFSDFFSEWVCKVTVFY